MQECGIAVAADFECEASIGPDLQIQDPRTVTLPFSAFFDPALPPAFPLETKESARYIESFLL